jgi:hypothetical protein
MKPTAQGRIDEVHQVELPEKQMWIQARGEACELEMIPGITSALAKHSAQYARTLHMRYHLFPNARRAAPFEKSDIHVFLHELKEFGDVSLVTAAGLTNGGTDEGGFHA